MQRYKSLPEYESPTAVTRSGKPSTLYLIFLVFLKMVTNPKLKKVWFTTAFGVFLLMVVFQPSTPRKRMSSDIRTEEEMEAFQSYIKRGYSEGPTCHYVEPQDHWSKIDVETMPDHEIVEYLSWKNSAACILKHEFGGLFKGNPPGMEGHKVLCIDPPVALDYDHCVVYSMGLKNDWSFEHSMHHHHCQVFVFDPSVSLPDHNHTDRISFYHFGIGEKDNSDTVVPSKTLASAYNQLKWIHGEKMIDVIQMTAESNGWSLLPSMIKSGMMDKVKQLTLEVYIVIPLPGIASKYRSVVSNFKALEDHGFVRFSSKINPWNTAELNKMNQNLSTYAAAFEISWYNGKLYENPY